MTSMLNLPAFPSLENMIFEQLDENNGKPIRKTQPRKKPTDQFANYEMNLFKMNQCTWIKAQVYYSILG